jgi:VanZ family protein
MTLSSRTHWLLIGGILFLTAYGSLYPMTGWRSPDGSVWAQFFTRTDRFSFGDVATNLVIYVPFGFVLVQLGASRRPWTLVLLATLAGFLLSGLMEVLQAFLPQRVSSVYDLALNVFGTAVGAIIGVSLYSSTALGRHLHQLRLKHCRDDIEANIGLAVLALWAASNLMPFIPSLDVGQIKSGFKPAWQVLRLAQPLNIADAVGYLCATLAIAAVATRVWRPVPGRALKTTLFVLGVLLLKGFIVSRNTSLEALLGATAGLALFRLLNRLETVAARSMALSALLVMLLVKGLQSSGSAVGTLYAFNWVPFRGHLQHTLTGVQDLAGDIWPYAALAFLLLAQLRGYRRFALPLGLLLVTAVAFFIEWRQQYIPDRLADITDVIIAAAAFIAPWLLLPKGNDPLRRQASRSKAIRYSRPGGSRRRVKHRTLPALLALIAAVVCGAWFSLTTPTVIEQRVDESKLARLPPPEELPAVQLPGFKTGHPRLPAPSAADIEAIRAGNRSYITFEQKRAKDHLQSAIFTEYVTPGSVDLEKLHKKLMGLQYTWRGNEQTKPIALAYDWLHEHWSPAQRKALLDKALEGCEYQIKYIREERLSPYNVYLYNSPLQALMACALATWGDSPRADPVMRFTHDYWKRRVLPVWRQVMGRNGGWHEGGEYVGIGIGQAIYQLPAMWRAATGEDVFRTEPGIAGFLDFLVYRNRPDNTYLRWGDGGYFDRRAEDAKALAIEYRHAAAYSLHGCPKRPAPTSWPWGPLPDDTLCDKTAEAKLPLSKLFDGIGMLVTRSDWGPDATHISFKAGDNYWSHTHLDQGAFTIFKRFPLAIDSGVYGPKYGSDHHMNYTYQTIAHNAVTVTDPADIIQAPTKDGTRYIANDGGQRRIGSGWGVEAAPLDFDEWLRKSETYRTGTILEHRDAAGFEYVVADLTPAYTNQWSGKGLFSPRTRRVNDYQRSFGYDRSMDLVVVYDRISVERPEFYVRWLLHAESRPIKHKDGFEIIMEPGLNAPQQGLSGMRVFTPAPEDRHVRVIGGPGGEFEIEGRNYDDNAMVQREVTRKKLNEAGSWRVELESSAEGFHHEFLVFMLPWVDELPGDVAVNCETTEHLHRCNVTRNGQSSLYRIERGTGRISR